MIGTTMAAWMLVVQLHSPAQPQEEQFWDMRYSNHTPEQCQDKARTMWIKYNLRYANTMTPWMQTFTTTCEATTAKHEYRWFIVCDQLDNCTTRKYKGNRS